MKKRNRSKFIVLNQCQERRLWVLIIMILLLTSCTTSLKSQKNLLLVSDGSCQLYLLHNVSSKTFFFNHYTGRSMSAGWASEISPGKWSAILVNQKQFNLSCHQLTQKSNQQLDCSRLIKMKSIKIKKVRNIGTYWIAENKIYPTLKRILSQRGFYLR